VKDLITIAPIEALYGPKPALRAALPRELLICMLSGRAARRLHNRCRTGLPKVCCLRLPVSRIILVAIGFRYTAPWQNDKPDEYLCSLPVCMTPHVQILPEASGIEPGQSPNRGCRHAGLRRER
jgi:hypothetical protein